MGSCHFVTTESNTNQPARDKSGHNLLRTVTVSHDQSQLARLISGFMPLYQR